MEDETSDKFLIDDPKSPVNKKKEVVVFDFVGTVAPVDDINIDKYVVENGMVTKMPRKMCEEDIKKVKSLYKSKKPRCLFYSHKRGNVDEHPLGYIYNAEIIDGYLQYYGIINNPNFIDAAQRCAEATSSSDNRPYKSVNGLELKYRNKLYEDNSKKNMITYTPQILIGMMGACLSLSHEPMGKDLKSGFMPKSVSLVSAPGREGTVLKNIEVRKTDADEDFIYRGVDDKEEVIYFLSTYAAMFGYNKRDNISKAVKDIHIGDGLPEVLAYSAKNEDSNTDVEKNTSTDVIKSTSHSTSCNEGDKMATDQPQQQTLQQHTTSSQLGFPIDTSHLYRFNGRTFEPVHQNIVQPFPNYIHQPYQPIMNEDRRYRQRNDGYRNKGRKRRLRQEEYDEDESDDGFDDERMEYEDHRKSKSRYRNNEEKRENRDKILLDLVKRYKTTTEDDEKKKVDEIERLRKSHADIAEQQRDLVEKYNSIKKDIFHQKNEELLEKLEKTITYLSEIKRTPIEDNIPTIVNNLKIRKDDDKHDEGFESQVSSPVEKGEEKQQMDYEYKKNDNDKEKKSLGVLDLGSFLRS